MSIKHRGYATGTRPATPVEGQVIFNTDKNILEVYTDSFWYPEVKKQTAMLTSIEQLLLLVMYWVDIKTVLLGKM